MPVDGFTQRSPSRIPLVGAVGVVNMIVPWMPCAPTGPCGPMGPCGPTPRIAPVRTTSEAPLVILITWSAMPASSHRGLDLGDRQTTRLRVVGHRHHGLIIDPARDGRPQDCLGSTTHHRLVLPGAVVIVDRCRGTDRAGVARRGDPRTHRHTDLD